MAGMLEGMTAVVTGGAGGIGLGITDRFAREGARVVAVDVDEHRASLAARTLRDEGCDVESIVADVTDPEDAARVFGRVDEICAAPDVLVNNVGHYGGRRGDFHEQSRDEWTDLYRVNLEHVLTCSQLAIQRVLADDARGSIVNVSTIEAFRGIPTRAVYSAFKAAISGLTRSLAVEYGGRGIRVNAIAPDVIETLQVPYSDWFDPEDWTRVPSWVPTGRLGQPADVAGVALFLASELSGFVTGTTVHVDGGTLAAGGWFPQEEGGWTNRPRRP